MNAPERNTSSYQAELAIMRRVAPGRYRLHWRPGMAPELRARFEIARRTYSTGLHTITYWSIQDGPHEVDTASSYIGARGKLGLFLSLLEMTQ